MPTVQLRPPEKRSPSTTQSPLPRLFQTPSGLAIVEIQGTVNAPGSTESSAPVGTLEFPHYDPTRASEDTSWHKRVYLYVGKHQRLTGEVKKLANPLAVVRRRPSDMDATTEPDAQDLEIAELIYYKLLFAHRPEPVGGAA